MHICLGILHRIRIESTIYATARNPIPRILDEDQRSLSRLLEHTQRLAVVQLMVEPTWKGSPTNKSVN